MSVDSAGIEANRASFLPASEWTVSDDGRYVVFESVASNFVDDDTNTEMDVFVARGLAFFADGFESGDTSAWSSTAQ